MGPPTTSSPQLASPPLPPVRPSKSAAELSIEEQQIIAEIQELQRQLRELKADQDDEPEEQPEGKPIRRRILVVANRLPIRATRDPRTARWAFDDAPGGLATALRGISMDVEIVWVGWVGCDVPPPERPRVTQRLMREHHCYPVYLETKLIEKYYNGFCNDVLWPLFHYVPLPMYQAGAEKKFDPSLWAAYKEANARFAQAVCEVYDSGVDNVAVPLPSETNPQRSFDDEPLPTTTVDDETDDDTIKKFKSSPATSSNSAQQPPKKKQEPSSSETKEDAVEKKKKHQPSTTNNNKGQAPPPTTATPVGPKKKKAADLVWVHDYHLMRLPLELRRREKNMAVAWFLHTPFPSSEIYRILPFRQELLEGLLHADLVGFHTYDYARHFLSACSRVLDVSTTTPKGIEYMGRFCSIGVFPIGIDPNQIRSALASRAVDKRARELGAVFQGRKVIIGVDRLDYIKGMPHKLLAFELFLAKYPQWIGRVTLIQVGVPTRTEVEEYRSLAKHVNELVGRINGVYGNLEYSPIHYINQSIPQDELIAIYHIADACLVTSVRDGMNLVSHEYVAAQADVLFSTKRQKTRWRGPRSDDHHSESNGDVAIRNSLDDDDDDDDDDDMDDDDDQGVRRVAKLAKDGPGVLVLSEFAGSAQSLSGAIRVNPWNTDELADAIHESLTLSRVERELRWAKLYRYVTTNTANYWARSFVTEFRDVCDHPPLLSKLPRLPTSDVLRAYEAAKHRLIVADYDGTLTQRQSLPQLATPAPAVAQLLATLAKDPKNTLYVMSGRERRYMEKWLGKFKVGLAAEFGYCHRGPDDPPGEWTSLGRDLDTSWKNVVQPIMQYFAERTPGTYIETKETSLAWHFQDADPHFGAWQAKDMQIHMEDVLANLPLEIVQGKFFVEVRHVGVNKALVLEDVLSKGPRRVRVSREDGLTRSNSDGGLPLSTTTAPAAAETADDLSEDFDFILCVGDDRSDEDMYQLLKAYYSRRCDDTTTLTSGSSSPGKTRLLIYLVRIGTGATQAEFFLENIWELRKILRAMASISLREISGISPYRSGPRLV